MRTETHAEAGGQARETMADHKHLEGQHIEVTHESGTYQGRCRAVSQQGFVLYSPDPKKPTREAGRYFSWDSVTVKEPRGEPRGSRG